MLGLKEEFREEAYVAYCGSSMTPLFQEGDKLLISFGINQSQLEPGDILLLKNSDEWISHRLVDLNGKTYLKGDWARELEKIDHFSIWGVVVGYSRKNSAIRWGTKGQRLKKLIARLSTMNSFSEESKGKRRWQRRICMAALMATNKVSTLLMIKQQR